MKTFPNFYLSFGPIEVNLLPKINESPETPLGVLECLDTFCRTSLVSHGELGQHLQNYKPGLDWQFL